MRPLTKTLLLPLRFVALFSCTCAAPRPTQGLRPDSTLPLLNKFPGTGVITPDDELDEELDDELDEDELLDDELEDALEEELEEDELELDEVEDPPQADSARVAARQSPVKRFFNFVLWYMLPR